MAKAAAILTLLGVLAGIRGTYLMTMAYHPFDDTGLFKNFLRVMLGFATFQWKSTSEMISKAAFFGEMNKEDRGQSLAEARVEALERALRKLVDLHLPLMCEHGREPDYCDSCHYLFEVEVAKAREAARKLLEGKSMPSSPPAPRRTHA